MVHALGEIRRVLKPGGVLLDTRPMEVRYPIEVVWKDGYRQVGELVELSNYLEDVQAADRAMQEVEARGWFTREQQETFTYFYYWDTPSEMKKHIVEEWEEADKLREEDYRAAQSAWAVANAEARVRVRGSIWMARWRKRDS